jgi:ABC-type multidrug transport system ATPase subunit
LDHYSIKVQGLTKAYTPFTKAVDNLSFALNPGDCFALLGITGAGKTTTFKCLTQEEIPDEGTLMMAGHNVRSQLGFSQARQMIGYCPQFDAIYEHLTVKEHLNFYATIKGVRPDYKNELVMR